jgi:acetyl-CoA acetyltransferase
VTTAIAGVGYSQFSRRSGTSVLELAREATQAAIDDAGLTNADVDGIASYMLMDDSVLGQAVSSALALPELSFIVDLQLGGQAPCHLVQLAAMAVETGQARNVLVFRAMNGRSGPKVGTMQFPGAGGRFRYPIGYEAYLMYVGMWASRFLYETGQDEHDLAAVALAQREFVVHNERAYLRSPLTLEEYLAQPRIADPYRMADCTIEVDGACAVLVTSLERARDGRHPPAVIASTAYSAGPHPGLDIGDHLLWEDYTRNYTSLLAGRLFGRAGLSPSDVDFAEIYDCFTSTVLIGLEGLGLCGRGESGAFVRSGATRPGGSLPTNTHGGLLAEGYLHGMNTVAEAVLQIQGRGGDRQSPAHEVGVVTSGALMDGSAMILTADR